jgi:rubrerythrin
MPKLKGTQTEKNLLKSFAGESQARNRYGYFASVAEKEGYIQISKIFQETADQERIHAKRFFQQLEGGMLEITAAYPAGKIATTVENLKAAAMGEHEEWSELYPTFAKVARQEGFESVAKLYEFISVAEKNHEKRYAALLKNMENGTVFKKSSRVTWYCEHCGYVHEGEEAPKACPACAHPQAHFQILAENW